MTVKILNGMDKLCVQTSFLHKLHTIGDLAYQYKCSRRTIIRVLEEGGIDPGIRRRKPLAPEQTKLEPLVFPDHAINPENIPWYRRFLNTFSRLFDPCEYADTRFR